MKWKRLLALLAAFALLAAACGGDDDTNDDDDTTAGADDTGDEATDDGDDVDDEGDAAPSGEAGSGGELVLLQWQAPSLANAYLSTGTKDIQAGSLVLEPLAEFAPDGQVVPALAAEIPTTDNGGISEDLTQVTWTLQEGLLWSDGTPVTAEDVVFTWEYCTDDLTGCSSSGFASVTDVVADDELSVTITFDAPTPWPFVPFVGGTSPVIQKAQFEECVGDGAQTCTDQNLSPVGTGPYVITDFRPEDTVTYAINENYRKIDEGKPFFATVQIKGGGDAESTARSVLEIGEADYAWNLQVAPEILAPMEGAGNGRVVASFTSNVEHININQANPESDPPSDYNDGTNAHPILEGNTELARALSLAINRDELVAVGYGAAGQPTCRMWQVPGQDTDANDWCLTQDIDEANKILDDLGYLDSDGDGVREADGNPLEFTYTTSINAVRQSNQALIESYWEEIGVDVTMDSVDASLFFDGTNELSIWRFPWDLEMFTNGPSGPDAQGYLSSYLSTQIPESSNNWTGDNFPRWNSSEFDELHAQLSATSLTDPARNDLIKELDALISSTVLIPLIFRGNVSAFANDIEGVGEPNGWDSEYWNIEDWTRAG